MRHEIKGEREADEVFVELDGEYLDPFESQQVWNHSPDGFNWGYHGSGPAQLALGILIELVPLKVATAHYQAFKREFIAPLPEAGFLIQVDVERWIADRTAKQKSEDGVLLDVVMEKTKYLMLALLLVVCAGCETTGPHQSTVDFLQKYEMINQIYTPPPAYIHYTLPE